MEALTGRAVIDRFLQIHPDIKLKAGVGLKLPGVQTMDMVPLMQIAGDISPDVIYVNFRKSDTYIQRGFLQPLDQFVAKMDPKELARRVPPAAKQVCYRKGPDGKKHWYALPHGRLVIALVYRRDLFAKAGLNPNKPPETWDELLDYSRKLTFPDKGNYGMGFGKGDGAGWMFTDLVWSRGGDVVVQDKKGEWHPAFNTEAMVDALYFYCRMNCEQWKDRHGNTHRGSVYRDIQMDISRADNPFAMYFEYLDDRLHVYQPELIGYAPIPHAPGYHSASEVNCQMDGIFAGVKDPKVIKAAWDYISFIDCDESNKIRVKMNVQRGFGKFINPDSLERFGYKDYLKQVDKRWVGIYKDAMAHGKPEPYGKNCDVIYHELSRPVEEAINDKTVLAALDRHDEKAVKARLREILARAQADTENTLFGHVPASVKRERNALTSVFLVITALAFTAASTYLFRTFRRDAPPQTPGQKKYFYAYMLLLPGVASVLIWQYYPLLRGTIMAFQDYNVMGNSPFVGIQNFSDVLFDAKFWFAVSRTLIYTALYMTFAFISPIVLALLLSEVPRAKILFRTIFYMPAVLSGLVVVFLWKSFYKPEGIPNVMLNAILQHGANGFNFVTGILHIHHHVTAMQISQAWLDIPSLAMAAVLLPVIWAGMGPGSLIYLAAFKTIPEELYEAAEVDGAGIRRKIWNITLPSIKMLIMINVVGAFTGAFMSSESIFAMTGGGPYTPNGSTEVVGLQLFYTAFMYLKFGIANSMAWVLGFMLIGFTMMQLRNLSRVEFKGGR